MLRLETMFPDYHPVVEMARLANDPDADVTLRFNANKEVAKYVVPQLKAVEHRGPDGGPVEFVINMRDPVGYVREAFTPAAGGEE
jgi:hypothetical protein